MTSLKHSTCPTVDISHLRHIPCAYRFVFVNGSVPQIGPISFVTIPIVCLIHLGVVTLNDETPLRLLCTHGICSFRENLLMKIRYKLERFCKYRDPLGGLAVCHLLHSFRQRFCWYIMFLSHRWRTNLGNTVPGTLSQLPLDCKRAGGEFIGDSPHINLLCGAPFYKTTLNLTLLAQGPPQLPEVYLQRHHLLHNVHLVHGSIQTVHNISPFMQPTGPNSIKNYSAAVLSQIPVLFFIILQ